MVLEANTIVIIIAVAVIALVLFVLLRPRRAAGEADGAAKEAPPVAEAPRRTVASKEVFAPLPEPVKAPEVLPAPGTTAEPAVAPEVERAAEVEPLVTKVAEPDAAKAVEPEVEPPVTKVVEPTVEAKAESEPAAEPKPEPEPDKKADAKPESEPAAEKKAESKPAAEKKAESKPAAEKKAEAKPAAEKKAEAKPAPKPSKAEAKPAKAGAKKAEDEVPWELRDDDEEAAPKKDKADEGPERTLADGLGRTRKEGFIAKLGSLFKRGRAIDDDLMDEVEEVLFTADIGVRTADRLMSKVREALSKKEMKDVEKVWGVLRDEALAILEAPSPAATRPASGPEVIMVLGVNGTGKTTSIGKLASHLRAEGRSVLLVAGDTFRAAAAEQLEHWGRRVGVEVFRGKEGQDPASVVFDGVRKGLEGTRDVILVDTAGRLHNNTNLMEELKKVRRVMGKAIDGAPHQVLLVLDATTGQNAVVQAKQFKAATEVTGVVLTKLDGTAKGGVVLGVCDELNIPVRWVGIGERVADIRAFDAREFVDELFQPPS